MERQAVSVLRRIASSARSHLRAADALLSDLQRSKGRVLHVYANRTNIGDWLSALGVQTLLSPLRPVELLCDTPFVRPTMTRIARANGDDLVILGGGGLFHRYFLPFWEAFAAHTGHLRYVVWGVGKCRDHLLRHGHQRLLACVLTRAQAVVVRDVATAVALRSMDISSRVIPCPSAVVLDHKWPRGNAILHVMHPDLLSDAAVAEMSNVLQSHADQMDTCYHETSNVIRAGSRAELAATLMKYSASDLVVSSRLHGCVIAAAMGRRVLAVSCDPKITAFMEMIGLSDQVISGRDVSELSDMLRQGRIASPPVPYGRWASDLNRDFGREIWHWVWSP